MPVTGLQRLPSRSVTELLRRHLVSGEGFWYDAVSASRDMMLAMRFAISEPKLLLNRWHTVNQET